MIFYYSAGTDEWITRTDSGTWTTSASTTMGDPYWALENSTSSTGGGTITLAQYQVLAAQQQAINSMLAQQCLTTQSYTSASNNFAQLYQPPQRERTPEEAAEFIRAQEAAQARETDRQKAHKRAEELLLAHLTPAQRETYTKNGWFVVEGKKQRYRIHTNSVAGNVEIMDTNRKAPPRLCGHCSSDIPRPDQHLAQKLMLEAAEDDFCRLANRS